MKMKLIAFRLPIILLILSITITSCSKKMTLASTSLVPSAQGKVTYKKDNNNNYSISVNIVNLVVPGKLTPPKKAYVVWMETDNRLYKNLGQINSSSGLFSSTMKGSLNTVTSFDPKEFFISAEDNPNTAYPGNMIVLTTDQ